MNGTEATDSAAASGGNKRGEFCSDTAAAAAVPVVTLAAADIEHISRVDITLATAPAAGAIFE